MAKTIQTKVTDEENTAFLEAVTNLGYRSKAAAALALVRLFLDGEVELPAVDEYAATEE